jgi:hypothetical protein
MLNKLLVVMGVMLLIMGIGCWFVVMGYGWSHPDMTEMRVALNTFWYRAGAVIMIFGGGSIVACSLDRN